MRRFAALLLSATLGSSLAIAIEVAANRAAEGVSPLVALWSEVLNCLP